jgi:hypothetical protein
MDSESDHPHSHVDISKECRICALAVIDQVRSGRHCLCVHGLDRHEAPRQDCAQLICDRTLIKSGVGVNAGVCLGWTDTKRKVRVQHMIA